MNRWTTGEKLAVVGVLGVVGWIIYANWNRRGNVAVEDAGETPLTPLPMNTYTASLPSDPYASGGPSAAFDLNKITMPVIPGLMVL